MNDFEIQLIEKLEAAYSKKAPVKFERYVPAQGNQAAYVLMRLPYIGTTSFTIVRSDTIRETYLF